jgi:hypothetical protein
MTSEATIEDLARAADDAGAALADDISELGDRLAPRQLVDDALETMKTRGLDLARDAGSTIKAHPIATGAAIAAVGLALYAGSRIANAELDIDRDIEGYTDYEDAALLQASGGGVDARELVKENPVVAILAGVAAGAALALLFPSSAAEKRSLGALARRITSR